MSAEDRKASAKAASDRWRAVHHEQAKANQRRSYHAHPEVYAKYREEHRAERAAYEAARWRARSAEERTRLARDSWNRHGRLYRYGVTEEQFLAMIEAQGGRCAICGREFGEIKTENVPHQDHDHETKANRGLLCFGCNVLLSRAHDDISVLEAAIAYLRLHQSESRR